MIRGAPQDSSPRKAAAVTRPISHWTRNPSAIFTVVTGVAFALRLVYTVQLSDPALNPAFVYPSGDAGVHHRWAQQLLNGSWPGPAPFFKAPLYPYLLGGLYAVFGNQSPLAVQSVHALISALGTGLAALSAWRLWSAQAAWSAGLLASLRGLGQPLRQRQPLDRRTAYLAGPAQRPAWPPERPAKTEATEVAAMDTRLQIGRPAPDE